MIMFSVWWCGRWRCDVSGNCVCCEESVCVLLMWFDCEMRRMMCDDVLMCWM